VSKDRVAAFMDAAIIRTAMGQRVQHFIDRSRVPYSNAPCDTAHGPSPFMVIEKLPQVFLNKKMTSSDEYS
jgi:ornithine carbamoyltransferase